MASPSAEHPHVEPAEDEAPVRHWRALRVWLSAIAVMVVAMVVVGGATRLTHSGLSITQWQPIVGIVPPLSEADWHKAFEGYKQIPEYRELNPNMDLAGFKAIFWWEWAHRFLGRMIGFVFFLPFIGFLAAGWIPRKLWPRLLGLFLLGGLQGFVGWYMVKSGLVDRTDVSQYRLTAHFGVAILIFAYCLWLIFGLSPRRREPPPPRSAAWFAGIILAMVYLQLLLGALVAGLDAGFGYNTWPLIAGAFIPQGLFEQTPWFRNLFENMLTVQFDHRMVAYAILAAVIAQVTWLHLTRKPLLLIGSAVTLAAIAMLQATLGIWTLLLIVPLPLGLAHQLGAVILFAAALYHFWLATHGVPVEEPQQAGAPQTLAKA